MIIRHISYMTTKIIVIILALALGGCSSVTNNLSSTKAPDRSTPNSTNINSEQTVTAINESVTPSMLATTIVTATPPVSQHPISLGQPARVGPVTFVVYGYSSMDWFDTQNKKIIKRLMVDIAIRNETDEMLRGPLIGKYAILGSDNQPLNREANLVLNGFEQATGLISKSLADKTCPKPGVDSYNDGLFVGAVARLLQFYENTPDLLPGHIYRGWIAFKPTTGIEQPNTKLEVVVDDPQTKEHEEIRAIFTLGNDLQAPTLAWTGDTATTVTEGEIGKVKITQVSISPIEPVMNEVLKKAENCLNQRTITMMAENTSAETTSLPNFILIDRDGRHYVDMQTKGMGFGYTGTLEPKEQREVKIAFPAIMGVQDQGLSLLAIHYDTKSVGSSANNYQSLRFTVDQK